MEGEKLVSVESLQAIDGADPHKAVFVLHYCIGVVRRQAIVQIKMRKGVQLFLLSEDKLGTNKQYNKRKQSLLHKNGFGIIQI
jgi:hypothetical protein